MGSMYLKEFVLITMLLIAPFGFTQRRTDGLTLGGATTHQALTSAIDIRRLNPLEASRSSQVELQGVVTMANSRSLVLQDSTGGVYVHYSTPSGKAPPAPGEIWRIRGTTGAGDFSPVVFADEGTFVKPGDLPLPVSPTWDQLLGGSLDAEYVEIQGVVIEASKAQVKLLTHGGVATLLSDSFYPLPFGMMTDNEASSLTGSLVRFRGVYASSWDIKIGRVHPAEFHLGNAKFTVEKPAPEDPFDTPRAQAKDLLGFTSHLRTLEPVKVNGVVLYAQPPLYFLIDGEQGFRAVCRSEDQVHTGDLVEVSGYPQPGGPSPLLQESVIRKVGTTKLPFAKNLRNRTLPDSRLDSTRVRLEATLLSDSIRQNERVLELLSDSNHFFAYLPASSISSGPLQKESILQITGIYLAGSSNKFANLANPFELRLLRESDIRVLKRGPWWTTRHTLIVISILTSALMLTAAWIISLRRTVSRRSAELAREIEERETVERHRALEQERSRVAQDLHDELGSGLTEAGFLTALMKNPAISPTAKNQYLDQLRSLCMSLVTGLDEIVWAVNPRYDSVSDLADYFSLFAPRFLELANIRCRLDMDHVIPEIPLDATRRHAIFLAVKEALTNLVRHSEATEATLRIHIDPPKLEISIQDNGKGFDPKSLRTGSHGVTGMKERLEQLGGTCMIKSVVGEGTLVRFAFPMKSQS